MAVLASLAAVMVVPPFYDPLSWRELKAHYTAVADAIGIPIMYYNLPSASGVRLTAEQLREELCELAAWLGLGAVEVEPRGDLAPALRTAVGPLG